jgi:hypothetical protein
VALGTDRVAIVDDATTSKGDRLTFGQMAGTMGKLLGRFEARHMKATRVAAVSSNRSRCDWFDSDAESSLPFRRTFRGDRVRVGDHIGEAQSSR